jgi:hypothetical protein
MAGLVTRFGTTIGVGTLGAAVAAVPAAIRVGARVVPACGTYSAWLVLAWAGVGPMLIAIVLFRGARVGLKAFGGEGRGARLAAFVLWALLEVGGLVLLGALLRATTHHHALAGVTFALAAVALAVGLALLSMRVAKEVSALAPGSRRLVLVGAALVIVLAVAMVARRFGLDASGGLGVTGATIVDLLAFFIVATFASRPEFVERRVLAILGPPAAATLLVLGVSAIRACPQIADATRGHAPVYSSAVDQWSVH